MAKSTEDGHTLDALSNLRLVGYDEDIHMEQASCLTTCFCYFTKSGNISAFSVHFLAGHMHPSRSYTSIIEIETTKTKQPSMAGFVQFCIRVHKLQDYCQCRLQPD